MKGLINGHVYQLFLARVSSGVVVGHVARRISYFILVLIELLRKLYSWPPSKRNLKKMLLIVHIELSTS